jgi:serine/threonine protein phosphatase PrpC
MMRIEVGSACRPRPGERACGDQLLVVREEPRFLVALADGLGHGPAACEAARAVIGAVAEQPWQPLPAIAQACHQAAAHTRGAALMLMRLDAAAREAACVGVGNVELSAVTREAVRPVPAAGIVGGRMRTVRETVLRIHEGDLFVLHTDGISSRFSPEELRTMDAGAAARRLLASHGKTHDDAACIVVRC